MKRPTKVALGAALAALLVAGAIRTVVDASAVTTRTPSTAHRRHRRPRWTPVPATTATTVVAPPVDTTSVPATTTPPVTTTPPTTTTPGVTTAPPPPATTTATTAAPPTIPPTTAPPGGTSTSACRFVMADQPVQVALCQTFDAPAGDPTTRSGGLDPTLWGVSRTNTAVNFGQSQYNEFAAAHLNGCGATQVVLPPRDVQVCNGRVVEAVNDDSGQPTLAMYPKQPFDIAGGRTGTIAFDVSADSQGPHAAWPELWWTDQPVPAAHGEMSAQFPYARNSFGFSLANQCAGNQVTVDRMMVTRSYAFSELAFRSTGCVTKGSVGGALNHVEVRINQSHVEVWATDAGGTMPRQIAVADNANITMTRGLVWLEHIQYNACKMDSQCDHTFAWDNLGFDGPAPYRDLAFDAPDAGVSVNASTTRLGYDVRSGTSVQVPGVYRTQTPTSALVTFNWFSYTAVVPSVRVNGGAWHDTAWPFDPTTFGWRTIAVTIPVAETRDGVNTIEFKSADEVAVSNIDLILVAASPAPVGGT